MPELSETDFNTLRNHYIADGMYDDHQCPFAIGDLVCDKFLYSECSRCSNFLNDGASKNDAA